MKVSIKKPLSAFHWSLTEFENTLMNSSAKSNLSSHYEFYKLVYLMIIRKTGPDSYTRNSRKENRSQFNVIVLLKTQVIIVLYARDPKRSGL